MNALAKISISVLLPVLSACSHWLPASGPSTIKMNEAAEADTSIIQLVDITPTVTQRLALSQKKQSFAESFTERRVNSYLVNPGDVIEVSIWEASPAMLFGVAPAAAAFSASSGSKASTLPEQMVGADGYINVPFAGRVKVAGKDLQKIETDIAKALEGKANYPQVIVRMTRNTTSNVTVVGEVTQSALLPITPRGERLLDAIAAAGGVRQPVNKITLQLSRGSVVRDIALEKVIQDPKQNIQLYPGDVVTAYYQPLSFTALGATGKNDEINFEAQGVTLAQAIGRVGGVQDARANASGVYVFRFESRDAVGAEFIAKVANSEGKLPIVYRLDMSDPAAFFVAQNFEIRNRDVLYVSNASAVELQKFLNILVSVIYPIVNVGNIVNGF
ncbi:polysaccharide export protein [Alcaligenaceae bacterium LF4-65]|uniref:Polysaccharide export protein n=1 Tax=Zwartia hollandica TaxID=324606 RepID=A0A953NAP8_9BURK|nr:polysaccharide biosynthesis/export family protein [Zwartia hollandica]MBZ1351043.1 polysaccharide export protein [Zwartia hollandica]